MKSAFKAKIGAGNPRPGQQAALPLGLFILRPMFAPTITRAFLMPVRLSPPTRERLRGNRPLARNKL
jgi:hypothetical protein